jgi:hypothetical protein
MKSTWEAAAHVLCGRGAFVARLPLLSLQWTLLYIQPEKNPGDKGRLRVELPLERCFKEKIKDTQPWPALGESVPLSCALEPFHVKQRLTSPPTPPCRAN